MRPSGTRFFLRTDYGGRWPPEFVSATVPPASRRDACNPLVNHEERLRGQLTHDWRRDKYQTPLSRVAPCAPFPALRRMGPES
jgi:hypothetical protein